MKYRPFGRTGWNVSEIGFGGWQIGGAWGKVDDRASVRTLLHAFEKGINFVDTAQLYGEGHSEAVIGEALKQWSGDKIYVATKAQPTVWPSPDDANPLFRGRFPEWHLRENVENSLRRLGVEQLDLFQLHCWGPTGHKELDWLETLNDLRAEGKIDQIGVSLRDNKPNEGVDLARLGLVASQQVIFNMFEQSPREVLFPAAKASDTAIIARVPLDSGSLVGHWTPNSYGGWEVGSQQHQMFRGDRFAQTLERLDKLKAEIGDAFPTLAEAAMRYVLSHDSVSVLIPGMKTPQEVDMNVAYSDGGHMSDAFIARLVKHAWQRNFYQ
ncbi:aldo/keto reductase [Celeribacter marinus]|uniref:Aldo/keto reductase n=1 Tax=Celeribacter marinus TaxID=1397108 RepID=A0A0N9ZIQ0_9RHOB|nr:aldo/keto reductase [Celeribacter marinus]ALI56543.1 aldo/keto reductase [Celeribacter marinus]SFK40223.1 Predicted oxidoreductase [Celeribacter marinus]